MEMAEPPHRRHGNFPQRRATLLPCEAECNLRLALEAMPSETGPNPSTPAEERSPSAGRFSRPRETEPRQFCSRRTRVSAEKRPGRSVAALLRRLRIHPEARRTLGNSGIAVVSLERLNFRSVSLSSLQPVVSLVRLPWSTHSPRTDHQQNGFSQNEADVLEVQQETPAGSPDLSPPGTTEPTWTEPYCPESPTPAEPEQDPGFDCDSHPDQPYILLAPECDEWDPDEKTGSEMFYLDPDRKLVIEIDPESGSDPAPSLLQAGVSEFQCGDQMEESRPLTQDQSDGAMQEPEAAVQELESEDFCAVCLNGGDLLCCDHCPKVYHLACHIPPLVDFPPGDWVCTLCRADPDPAEAYDCENTRPGGGVKAPYALSTQDQQGCEKLTLLLYCHLLSTPFHEPVSPLARNYYQVIKRPMDLSVIRKKLDRSNTLHFFTAEQFIDDIMLMFKNCATFNYPDSEVAQAGHKLEVFFLSRLKEIFPDRRFPSASQDRTNRARLQWLSRTRKKKHLLSGKKYYT